MVRRIIWSRRANLDRKEILKYWKNKNKSADYSKKLNSLIKEAIRLVARFPEMGRATNNKTIRIKIVRDYWIFYDIDKDDQLQILTIWGSKQDPEQIKWILRK